MILSTHNRPATVLVQLPKEAHGAPTHSATRTQHSEKDETCVQGSIAYSLHMSYVCSNHIFVLNLLRAGIAEAVIKQQSRHSKEAINNHTSIAYSTQSQHYNPHYQ